MPRLMPAGYDRQLSGQWGTLGATSGNKQGGKVETSQATFFLLNQKKIARKLRTKMEIPAKITPLMPGLFILEGG